jgi:hypothetical protein
MPQASLVDLVEAMADQIRAAMDIATAATDITVQVEPFRVIVPTTPTVDIYPADEFRVTEGAHMGAIAGMYRFTVRARIDTAGGEEQQILLDMLDEMSDYSVAAALADDERLGGLADDLSIESHTGHRQYIDTTEAGAYLGVEWSVLVLRAFS